MSLTFLYGYQTPPVRKSVPQLDQIKTWNMLYPEFRRRLVSMFTAALGDGTDLGFGGGWRSSEQQEALFRSRYVPDPRGTIFWEGQYWKLKPGMAPSTPPYRSYHESTFQGWALAADLIGDLKWLAENCARFGLKEFSKVNNEPWHCQPSEIENSRSRFNGLDLKKWVLPEDVLPDPKPIPPVLESELMLGVIAINDQATKFSGWTDGKGHYLQVSWVHQDTQELTDAEYQGLLDAGAKVDTFDRYTMKYVVLLGPIPPGWSESDFKAVIR